MTDFGDVVSAPPGRFEGIERPYSADDVLRLRGSLPIEHTLARRGALKLWQLLQEDEPVRALGAVLIFAAVMGFYVQSIKSGHAVDQQLKLLTTMRTFTEELIFTGSRSHELVLYNSSDATDRTFEKRKIVINDDTESEDDDICPTGNFAVFVFYELPKPAAQSKYRIAKLVGYYLDTVDSGPPRLVRVTIDKSSSPSTDTIETLLSDNWSTAKRETLAHRVNALALSDNYTESTIPQLFYRRANQNLAVCGQLLESTTRINTKDRRSYTRTFYFNVTVRS